MPWPGGPPAGSGGRGHGGDNHGLWIDPKNPADPTGAKVVWTGENEAAKAYGKSLRLCRGDKERPTAFVGKELIVFTLKRKKG